MENRELEDAVLKEYEQTLVVPEHPPKKLCILCPVGLVGAGKSTVVKPLSEKLSFLRIVGDDIRKLLKEQGSDYEPVSRIGEALVRKYLAQGVSVAVDSDCAGTFRPTTAQWEKDYGATLIWIHINPPEEFILHKLRTFKHTWLFKDADDAIANYTRRKPLHEHLEDIPFVYMFDTSRADLSKQVEEAAAIIEKIAAGT